MVQDTVACVLDFGMAERTCAPFDLAVALERSMIDWLHPEAQRTVYDAHITAFLQGYAQVRPLSAQERACVAAFLPLVHVEFALSEVAYFGGLLHDTASAEVAYTDYLLGHAQWFSTPQGQAVLHWVQKGAPLTTSFTGQGMHTGAKQSSGTLHTPHTPDTPDKTL
ncbi:aminoglycoside phosphotransferase/kinase family protein [Acetobacter orientalis]|uniref:Aminoglycoside phospho transferase n=1 Tax=Acetobacter orientalis TaxID=146474 RepID=A0A0D6NGF9_9PROT|nr:hypothetical protein [Acetobacter orientalis]GAN64720.1 aminoglycoside phospho transferase [Acetobacter orientalis]